MNIQEIIDELLIKQLLNETTADENLMVNNWRAENDDNEKHYQDFKIIWESSRQLQEATVIDANISWIRFQERIAGSEIPIIPFKNKFGRFLWLKVAAALIIVAGGLLGLNMLLDNQQIIVASNNQVHIATLPDGSVITLNKHSSLAYSKHFNEKTREVELQGEAFFSVAPNKQKPFEIKVGAVNVKVVGTSFNIKETIQQTEVIVETGIVKVRVANDSVKLLPKEKVVVNKSNSKLDVTKSGDLLYNYYRTKTFECINTPLFELIDALNKTYDTKIIITNESTRNLPYTSTFKDMPLNDILKVITQTFNLTIEQHNGEIILK